MHAKLLYYASMNEHRTEISAI